MLPLLLVSLILCLVSISVKGCKNKIPSKIQNESVVAILACQSRPWCHVCFMQDERLEYETKVSLGYYYLSTSYVESILEAAISRVFSYPDVGLVFEIYIYRSRKFGGYIPCRYFRTMLCGRGG